MVKDTVCSTTLDLSIGRDGTDGENREIEDQIGQAQLKESQNQPRLTKHKSYKFK